MHLIAIELFSSAILITFRKKNSNLIQSQHEVEKKVQKIYSSIVFMILKFHYVDIVAMKILGNCFAILQGKLSKIQNNSQLKIPNIASCFSIAKYRNRNSIPCFHEQLNDVSSFIVSD